MEWNDATDDTNFKVVKTVSTAIIKLPLPKRKIICDVRGILGRLVGKASQLLGMLLKTIQ